MQAPTHQRHVKNGRAGIWRAALVIAVSLVLGVAGGLALTDNLPWQADAAIANPAVVSRGSSDAAVNGRWAQMQFEEANGWGADFVLPASGTLPQTSDDAWAIEARQELAQAKALSPLKAYYAPGMGEGLICGCQVDIAPRQTPLVQPYNEGLGTIY